MAESAPQPPKDDIEAAATQEPVQIEIAPADGDRSSSSNKDKEQTYERHLYDYIKMDLLNLRRHPKLLDFQKLSLMNIVHLTNELAKYDQAIEKDEAAPQDIERVGDLLHRYSKFVQFAVVIVFPLMYLHVSYRGSGPRILVKATHTWGPWEFITYWNVAATLS